LLLRDQRASVMEASTVIDFDLITSVQAAVRGDGDLE
jgi:hypothetical protein